MTSAKNATSSPSASFSTADGLSLRERRRLHTWQELHHAASELTIAHGPTAVTVDAIAEAAGVSSRTFFNYFPTKEDAILGLRPPVLSEDAAARFLAGEEPYAGSTLNAAASLYFDAVTSTVSTSRSAARITVIRRFPELALHATGKAKEADTLVREFFVQRLTEESPRPEEDAAILLLVFRAAIRHSFRSRSADTLVSDHGEHRSGFCATVHNIIDVLGRFS